MRKKLLLTLSLLLAGAGAAAAAETVSSPDGRIVVKFDVDGSGRPCYSMMFEGKNVINNSLMGFDVKQRGLNFSSGFSVSSVSRDSVVSQWAPVWGENDTIAEVYNSMTVSLTNRAARTAMNIEFKVFDDGMGFRYIFPRQKAKHITVTDELTQFAMPGDMTAWWIPGDYETQEYEYTRSRLSEIRDLQQSAIISNLSQKGFSPTGVQTSLMLKSDDGKYMNIHEAALVDFPAMHLNLNDTTMVFTSWLTPDARGNKAEVKLPFSTPWRAVMVGDKATDILASDLILNLNEPNKLDDTSWIKPVKYMGVWWEMITGKSQWSYTDAENFDLATFDYSKAKPHGKHGANNENVKRYIDFAAEHGFDQVLVEGWNTGWEDWFGKHKDFVFDFVTPYPDFDLKGLNDYARSKGVRLMMHHETSGSIPNYERWMDRAYKLMNDYGYNAVKSGYVGDILPLGENHYNQWAVNHYLNAVKKAADHKIMVNAHEAVRPTGLARTYPNLIGNESALGTEYQNMSPTHVTVLPFTRLKGGPMDFTPGIFRTDLSTFAPGNNTKKRATTANQLALYVTMYSPLQMAADMPEHYAEKLDAFQFIKDVPVDWSKSIYLDAEPGEFIVVARKDKHSDNWYVGGVSGDKARHYDLKLDFLTPGRKYEATVYMDSLTADCDKNPESYEIRKVTVDSSDTLPLHMARGGGFAISLKQL